VTGRLDKRREEILGASYKLFGERGYRDTNIADIAQELGLGHGTFYRYFKNKRDIFVAVVDMVITRIATAASLESPDAATDLASYRAQIRRIGNNLFDLFVTDHRLSRILFFEAPGVDREIDDKIQNAQDIFARVTEAYLLNGQARGFLKKGFDTLAAAQAVNAMTFEGVRRVLDATDRTDVKERWIATATLLMLDGMAAQPVDNGRS